MSFRPEKNRLDDLLEEKYPRHIIDAVNLIYIVERPSSKLRNTLSKRQPKNENSLRQKNR
jgi:hypothetical protein